MSFKENKYIVIKGAVSKELADFCYDYFLLKRKVVQTLFANKIISPFNKMWGVWNDAQVPETYSHYADIVMETLLTKVQPIMKEKTELKLIPTYSYARIYKKGDELKRHKDRPSCEVSTTLNLGGDPWSIYLSPDENVGIPENDGGEKGITVSSNARGMRVDLEPGDMLIYKGCELEHWRKPFEGENCAQVFLHYNNIETQDEKNKYDGRIHLGLPKDFTFMK